MILFPDKSKVSSFVNEAIKFGTCNDKQFSPHIKGLLEKYQYQKLLMKLDLVVYIFLLENVENKFD